MIKRVNKVKFGKTLRQIRIDCGYTQEYIAKKADINILTLRRIEKGENLPKIQLLENLSLALKTDLLRVFIESRDNNDINLYHHNLDELIINNDHEAIGTLIKTIRKNLSELNSCESLENLQLSQFVLLLEGLDKSIKNASGSEKALKLYIEAILLTLPTFQLEDFDQFHYSFIELKCLYVIAIELNLLGKYSDSNRLSLFLLKYLHHSQTLQITDNTLFLKIKILLNIAYNYHGMSDDTNAFKYADKGINICLKYNTMYLLHSLYYRRAVAQYHINSDTQMHIDDFMNSIWVLKLNNMTELRNTYIQVTRERYKIHLE